MANVLPSPRTRPTPRSVVYNMKQIRDSLSVPEPNATPRGQNLFRTVSETVAPYLSVALGAVLLIDSRSRILAFNSLAAELFEQSGDEIRGNSLGVLMPLSEESLGRLAEESAGMVTTASLCRVVWGIDVDAGNITDTVVRVLCNGSKLRDVLLSVSKVFEPPGKSENPVYVFRFNEQMMSKNIDDDILEGKKCENVTLFACKVVNFGQLLNNMPCSTLLTRLSAMFDRMDGVIERYGLVKLRVSGDMYMACTSLSGGENVKENANACVDFALHCLDMAKEVVVAGEMFFQMRVGIHTGKVVAGVVDRNPSTVASIDLFGESVSAVHRMQLHGVPNAIHISHATYQLLDMRFDIRTRGVMHVHDDTDDAEPSGNSLTYLIPARSNTAAVTKTQDGRRMSAQAIGLTQGQLEAALPDHVARDIEKWSFNVVSYNEKELISVGFSFFERLDFLERFNIPRGKLTSFLELVRSCYRHNPYHNFFHAIDVAHCTFMYITTGNLAEIFEPIDLFSLLLASICHDLDHPGLSSSFLVRTHDPLAILYNDKSVLEQHHCTTMYRILMREESNILCSLTPEDWNKMRRKMIGIILATDMELHGDYMRRLNEFVKENAGNVTAEIEADKKQFLLEILMKSADISNIVRPFFIAEIWAEKIQDEFFYIGDSEKKHGFVPLPFMDREKNPQVPIVQKNFISAVGTSLFMHVGQVFPNLGYLGESIKSNLEQWGSRLSS